MMFFSSLRFVKALLFGGLLILGQQTVAQNVSRKTAPTNYVEKERLASHAFDLPMHIKPELAGSFAELRVNHFHSGVDFKTLHGVGYPIYAPADGWVSRIRIEGFGFGNALYLDHNNGFTTVYGHLQGFAEPIASTAERMQYKNERFELDTLLLTRRIPVRKGQLIAYSGNSGISVAPHLHFEIRDTRTEETIDPLLWFSNDVNDNIPPKPQKLAIYALQDEGVLSNGKQKSILPVAKDSKGEWTASGTLPTAWGKIGIGLCAYDYMNGTSNLYGVCSIRLFVNNELIFQQDLSRFSFDQTRYVNSLIDYEAVQQNNIWIMKSFVEPGNHLNAYPVLKDQGYILINEQKKYTFRYELMDRSGNSTVFNFSIQGQKRAIPQHVSIGKKMLYWVPNYFNNNDLKLEIPLGALYGNLDFQFNQRSDSGCSDIFQIQNSFVPLQKNLKASFRIRKETQADKRHYYLAKVTENGLTSYVPSIYKDGWVEAALKTFGTYKVLTDTILPKISVPKIERIAKNDVIRIHIADNASGIKSWRGTIDGKWALFALNGISGRLSCVLDSNRITTNRLHELRISVVDGCGNENHLTSTFSW